MQNFLEISRYERALRSFSSQIGVNKIDYSYKSSILDKGIDKEFNSFKLQSHYNNMRENNFDLDYGLYIPQCCDSSSLNYWFDDLAHRYGFCAILEARRILNANYHRVSRLRSRIQSLLDISLFRTEQSVDPMIKDTAFREVWKRPYFLTLTFTNSFLKSTSSITRRRYVTRFLKLISDCNYVANIDYGSKNGREHYHAVVVSEFIDCHLWKYGHIDYEIINIDDKVTDKLSLYVSKLCNHAIKKTTKRNSLLYPKGK